MTNEGTIRTSTLGYEHHFTVPGDTGVWDLWNIQSATLKVLDGTVAASTTSGGSLETSTPTLTDGGSLTTPAPTLTVVSTSASGSGSGDAPASTGAADSLKTNAWTLGLGMGIFGIVITI